MRRNSPIWQDVQSVNNFSSYFANTQTINQSNKQTNTYADRQINAGKRITTLAEVNMNLTQQMTHQLIGSSYSCINIQKHTVLRILPLLENEDNPLIVTNTSMLTKCLTL